MSGGDTSPKFPVARVPAGTRVYAIGDCHGCLSNLAALHRQIAEDSAAVDARAPASRQVLIYVGDYVDRGPDSRELLDLLIEAPLDGFETVYLLGNHDLMMREALAGGGDVLLWIANGGDATLRSYGADEALRRGGGEPLGRLDRALKECVPAAHRQFLADLRLSHIEGDYMFVHAGIDPHRPFDAQREEDLLWIREPFLSATNNFGKVVVHGHTPAAAPVVRTNRIAIDTGACYGGQLTALVLEADRQRFLHA